MIALSSPASMPSPWLRPSEISPCRSWRITTWVWPTMFWATIVGRWVAEEQCGSLAGNLLRERFGLPACLP